MAHDRRAALEVPERWLIAVLVDELPGSIAECAEKQALP